MAAARGAGGAAPSAYPLGAPPPPPPPGTPLPRHPPGRGRARRGQRGGPVAPSPRVPPGQLPPGQGHAPAPPPRDGTGRARSGGRGAPPGRAPPRPRCCPATGRQIRLFRPQKNRARRSSPVKGGWSERPRDSRDFFVPPSRRARWEDRERFPQWLEGWGARGGGGAWKSRSLGGFKAGGSGGDSAGRPRVPQRGRGARRAAPGPSCGAESERGPSAGGSPGKRERID